jgi:hypothetical protein
MHNKNVEIEHGICLIFDEPYEMQVPLAEPHQVIAEFSSHI